ncbi:MAG: polyprenyl synthetase family protein [Candidatus Aquicultorales bacterium]
MKKYPISGKVLEDLVKVEAAIVETVSVEGEMLGELSLDTLSAGGKRLRPALVLICGQVGGYDLDRLMPAAVSVELVHTASLIHDDVLDEATTRRGRPTVYARLGESIALAAGDFLFSKAFEKLAGVGDAAALSLLSEAAVALCLGEFNQMETAYQPEQSVEGYLKKIGQKTAALFAACCGLGGLLSGASEADRERLSRFGYDLGLAFQIYDDILDISGGAELGKSIGTDLKDGTVTLPMLYALEELEDGRPLRRVIETRDPDPSEIDAAIASIIETGAIGRARDEAKLYVDKAMAAAEGIADKEVAEQLAVIGEFVIDRYH